MSMTLGKIMMDDDWNIYNIDFKEGQITCKYDRNDDKNFINHDGGLVQSLNDLLVIKFVEQIISDQPIMKDNGKIFLPTTQENQYWVEISFEGSEINIEVGEPAA